MTKIKILLVLLVSCAFVQADSNRYCNARFQVCATYPAGFVPLGESANGDGQAFLSADSAAAILVYGSLAVEDFDKLEQQYQAAAKELQVTYQLKKENWYILSGTDKAGKVVYMKTIKKTIDYFDKGPMQVFQTISVTYPPNQQQQYKDYCMYIAKSLE